MAINNLVNFHKNPDISRVKKPRKSEMKEICHAEMSKNEAHTSKNQWSQRFGAKDIISGREGLGNEKGDGRK